MPIETIFTTPNNHELNRLIDTTSSSKKRPAMRIRLLNIFKYKSRKSSSAQTSSQPNLQRRQQQQRQQQHELATLGTIELNSYDELKLNNDDDVDDNHGLSSCGSALQLTQIGVGSGAGGGDDSDEKYELYSSFGSLSSRSQVVNDETKELEERNYEGIPKECSVSLDSKELCTTENRIASYEERIISLFQTGKELYKNGSYKHALRVQKDALKVVNCKSAYASKKANSSSVDGKECSTTLHKRQQAMIQYEIAKIEFVIFKEQSYYYSTDTNNELVHKRLSRLFGEMQDAKCKVSLQDLIYYQDLLAQMENDDDTTRQDTNLPFDKFHTYQKIEILNILGKICHKDLHKYEDALRYYKVALELESYFLKHIMCKERGCNNQNEKIDTEEMALEIEVWKIKIRQTKRKIGAIHYMNGRFDMALLSSFSHTRSYSESPSTLRQS